MCNRFAGICAAVLGTAVVSYLIGSAIKGADLPLVVPLLFAIQGFTVGSYLAFRPGKAVVGIRPAVAEGGIVTATISTLLVLLFVALGVRPTPAELLSIPALTGSGALSGLCYAALQKCLTPQAH